MKLIINRAPGGVLSDGVREEIEAYHLELAGVLPQDDAVYEADCDGKPSSKIPDASPVKRALHGDHAGPEPVRQPRTIVCSR